MIPFLDLQAQHECIRAEIVDAIAGVIDSCRFALGPEVTAFEEEYAAYCGSAYGVAVNSGTSALHLALLAAGVGPGDEVITVPMTFVATVEAIRFSGAQPVFVDIDPYTFTMDPVQIEAAVSARTRAIIPVHLYGQPADMDPILAVAKRRGVRVIEDACQAHGAEYKGRRSGSLGELGCFSFYPGKNLGAVGEGGMVVTDDATLAVKLRMMRDWGQEKKYHHVLRGFNYRMDGIQGAVLRVKLRYLEGWTEARRAHARRYDELLADCGIETPCEAAGRRHVYHIYALRTKHRDRIQQALDAAHIQWGLHYPVPVHLLEAHADLGYRLGRFPVSEKLAAEEISIPMYPELEEASLQEVARGLRSVYEDAAFAR